MKHRYDPKGLWVNRWMSARARLALLKESAAYRAFWKENSIKILSAWEEDKLSIDNAAPLCHLSGNGCIDCKVATACHIDMHFRFDLLNAFSLIYEDSPRNFFPILDPYNEGELPDPLPNFIMFSDQRGAIEQVLFDTTSPNEHNFGMNISVCEEPLAPGERMFIIDVTRRKSDILAEMGRFLDSIAEFRKRADNPWVEEYAKWQPETERQREEETWQALKVWKLRRQKKTFLAISKETGLRVPAAKKAFARVYELIEGRRYEPEKFKKVYQEIQSAEVKRTCKDCLERDTCVDPCPDVLPFLEQDYVGLAELISPP